jgi:hypothetical protein
MRFSAAASSENDHGSVNLALEHRPAGRDHAVKRRPHPSEHRMPQPMLDALDGLPGVALVPEPVEVLGREPQGER